MINPQFNAILKSVSRSFYLSMRILPSAMQVPIAIAYLLARAADAIADTAALSHQQRLVYLNQFKASLFSPEKCESISLQTLIESIDHEGEQYLLKQLRNIFLFYQNLPKEDFLAVQKVVDTLTTGMEQDLQYFSDNEIKALANDAALNEYTYYVAGCVGEFWTILSINHVRRVSHWRKDHMTQLGIEFGKALQLTNILRDIAKDVAMGRSYLPATDLDSVNMTCEMLTDPKNNSQLKPVINKWLKQADQYFESAEKYLLSIPRSCLRLRLAALWPILIGLATLNKISQQENFLSPNINVKVKRAWVYKMIILSVPASFSNTLLHYWITSIRRHSVK